jgi:hypothetical protein
LFSRTPEDAALAIHYILSQLSINREYRMASIKQALGAFALTWMAATAGATPVEVVFDVTATSRTMHEWFDNSNHQMTDPDFEPVAFTIALSFDPDRILTQHVDRGTVSRGYAYTRFVGGTGTPAITPFYPLLHSPRPQNGVQKSGSDAAFGKDLQAFPSTPGQLLPVLEHASLLSYEGWRASYIGEPDAVMEADHRQIISLQRQGTPISINQLTKLSGEDALSFLQSQIGITHVGGYAESGGIVIRRGAGAPQGPFGLIADRGVVFNGDVTIRSVTAVPEASGFLMGMIGMAVVALCLGARRRYARAPVSQLSGSC